MLQNLTERIAWAIETIKADKTLDKGITDVALAKILGTNKDTLAGYRREKGLLKGEVIDNLVAHYQFSPMWLFKGEGEPFPGARAKYPEVCGPEPATERLYIKEGQAAYAAGGAQQAPAGPEIRISEAMTMMARVLESGTSYATALYFNIVHFDRAIAATQELHACQDRITNLETQVAALRRQVDGLTARPASSDQPAEPLEKAAM